jgi:hypothetical protein
MPGGRPTKDPKGTLVAVRLAERHLAMLEERARRDAVSVSEAIRRCLDDWAAGRPRETPRRRPPNAEERATLKELYELFDARPRRGRPTAKGRR